MIRTFRVQGYKALRDVTLNLTPIHVLIGQNDTGKTSLLEAIAALCRSVEANLSDVFPGRWHGCELVSLGNAEPLVQLDVQTAPSGTADGIGYSLGVRFAAEGRHVVVGSEVLTHGAHSHSLPLTGNPDTAVRRFTLRGLDSHAAFASALPAIHTLHSALHGVRVYRLEPRMLALPTAPDSARRGRMEPSGFGLAQFLDEILSFDRDAFAALEREFLQMFPHIESLKLQYEPGYQAAIPKGAAVEILSAREGKGIWFKMRGRDRLVPAASVSDGLLLTLAYIALTHSPVQPPLLLVEEPELGIHPDRLREFARLLRTLVDQRDDLQIILTTHSPYLLDEFKPEEVTVCTRTAGGDIRTRRLSESPFVRQRQDVFTLGEIWTAAESEDALFEHPEAVAEDPE